MAISPHKSQILEVQGATTDERHAAASLADVDGKRGARKWGCQDKEGDGKAAVSKMFHGQRQCLFEPGCGSTVKR